MYLTCGEFGSDIGAGRLKVDFLGIQRQVGSPDARVICITAAGILPATRSHSGVKLQRSSFSDIPPFCTHHFVGYL